MLACPTPFDSECRVDSWLAASISRCDGAKTIRDHIQESRWSGMPDAYQDGDVAAIFVTMISAGVLTVDEP
jgi:hypothetical protein